MRTENGLCRCGCGQKTALCKWPHPERGHVVGQPLPYIRFHKARKHPLNPAYAKNENDCWNWLGCIDDKGYGRHHEHGQKWMAHVYMFTKLIGPIPENLYLDHLCTNKRCVNPAHLRLASRSQNGAYRPKPKGVKRRFSSIYKGVARVKNKWKAYICLGTFDTETEAAQAYNVTAKRIFGKFAFTNTV